MFLSLEEKQAETQIQTIIYSVVVSGIPNENIERKWIEIVAASAFVSSFFVLIKPRYIARR